MGKKLIYTKKVSKKTGLSRQTIWRYIKANKFPPPQKVGNRNCWLKSTINDWIDDQLV